MCRRTRTRRAHTDNQRPRTFLMGSSLDSRTCVHPRKREAHPLHFRTPRRCSTDFNNWKGGPRAVDETEKERGCLPRSPSLREEYYVHNRCLLELLAALVMEAKQKRTPLNGRRRIAGAAGKGCEDVGPRRNGSRRGKCRRGDEPGRGVDDFLREAASPSPRSPAPQVPRGEKFDLPGADDLVPPPPGASTHSWLLVPLIACAKETKHYLDANVAREHSERTTLIIGPRCLQTGSHHDFVGYDLRPYRLFFDAKQKGRPHNGRGSPTARSVTQVSTALSLQCFKFQET